MERLREFDFVRAVAALSVIAIHVTGIYVYNSRAAYVWNQGMRYAVPLFIILSGLLLAYSYKAKVKVGYSEFFSKRFNKIVIPYLLWSVIYLLFNLRGKPLEMLANSGGTVLKNLAFGTSELHLYFVIIILQLYALYPLLAKLLERWRTATLAAAFGITFYFQLGIYLSNIKVARILPRTWIPYYETFMPWIFFFVFGMFAAQRIDTWKEKLLKSKHILLGVWFVSFAILLTDSIITKTNADSIKPTVMLYCMTSFFFFYVIALNLKSTKRKWGAVLDWFSKQSFLIYLSHILIQSILRGIVKKIGLPGIWDGRVGMVLFFIATVLSTMIFVYIVSLTHAASWLGGVREKTGIGIFKGNNKANIGV